MIEYRRSPPCCRVTLAAILGKIPRHVTRIACRLEILEVAVHASRRRQVVIAVHVAIRALPRRHRVHSGQGKSCAAVIEVRIEPTVGAVACLAGHREFARCVIRVRGACIIGLVAGVALRRHRLKLAVGGVLMAGIAIHRGMSPGERKTIVVILNFLDTYFPSLNRVALRTIGAQLPPVNIRVAILAALSNIGEDRLHVALRARNRLMHAEQRISRLIVIELRNGSRRLPRIGGMAVLTGKV